MNNEKPNLPIRLLTERETRERIAHGHTWLWKAVKSGAFARPVKHGRTIRFIESEVEAWIRARIADRDGTTGPRLLFTEREVADALGISVSLLQKDRISAQRIPFVKLGQSVRYDMDEVVAALKATPIRGREAEPAQVQPSKAS